MLPATEQQLLRPVATGSTESIIKQFRLKTLTNSAEWLLQQLARLRSYSSAQTPESAEETIIREFAQKNPEIFLT
ncbi:MAG: hypothetical protein HGB15_03405 [Chlorobaculum sp.]|jgi:hypothetical protein|nr:hypothetical protein [Chlorobaculum sp.]